MTQIILARHGETEWNVSEVFRGRVDIELSETGIRQTELLAKYLSDMEIDAIYASPLKRALSTAENIAKYHKNNVLVSSVLLISTLVSGRGYITSRYRKNTQNCTMSGLPTRRE